MIIVAQVHLDSKSRNDIKCCGYIELIGASLSEPHHVRSTVKSVFLLACLLACLLEALPYMAKSLFKCKPTLHQVH